MLWDLTTAQFIVTGSFICCTSFICGWFSDKIVGRLGFGAIGNWLLLLLGAYLGMYGYNTMGYYFQENSTKTIFVVGAAALLMLMTMMTFKRILKA